jgi:hypothetical protein
MTVTGTLKDASGTLRTSTRIIFTPESNPAAHSDGATILAARPVIEVTTNASTAVFSTTLLQGLYLVQIGRNPEDRFHINVPSGTGTASITTMIVAAASSDMWSAAWFVAAVGTNYQYNAGYYQIKNFTTNLFHTLWVTGAVGSEQLLIETPGVVAVVSSGYLPATGNNYRLKSGVLQFYNATTLKFYPLWVTGEAGSEVASLGAGEA